jgi:hypothetical protein
MIRSSKRAELKWIFPGTIVFPGFEIAANDKTHFVCLFEEDTERKIWIWSPACLNLNY